MSSKVVEDSLKRISQRLPDLGEEDLMVVEECLESCFELGRAWDSIPILVEEAKPPPISVARKRLTR